MHATDTPLMALKKKDRKVFTMLTTAHTTAIQNGKPECVQMYNTKMNAVDRSDQMVNNSPLTPKI